MRIVRISIRRARCWLIAALTGGAILARTAFFTSELSTGLLGAQIPAGSLPLYCSAMLLRTSSVMTLGAGVREFISFELGSLCVKKKPFFKFRKIVGSYASMPFRILRALKCGLKICLKSSNAKALGISPPCPIFPAASWITVASACWYLVSFLRTLCVSVLGLFGRGDHLITLR